MSTSQRTEDQWPMTSWLVHVARARVHVTTRVTTRASELSTWLHMHIYHDSKICTYIQEILLSRPAFFSSHLRCYRVTIKFLYLSLFFNIFSFFYFFKSITFFYIYTLKKLILMRTRKDSRFSRMEQRKRINL